MKQHLSAAPATLVLSLVTAALAEFLLSFGLQADVRTQLLGGVAGTLGMALLTGLLAEPLSRCRPEGAGRFVYLWLGVWLAAELIQLLWQAHQLCWQQFSSLAVIGLAPGLLWIGWCSGQPNLDHTARILWWFVAVGGLIALLGLGEQARWQRLMETDSLPATWTVPLYAEYFALPMLCSRPQKSAMLPFVSFGIQISFAFAVQMVFGVKADEYGGAELLRAMSLGVFSRLDALLVLIWLISGLFRICLLSYLIHGFYSALKKEVPPC